MPDNTTIKLVSIFMDLKKKTPKENPGEMKLHIQNCTGDL